MHGKKWIGVCLIALCGVSGNALADWKGKGELGASLASGNSESESANAALEVKNTRDKWTHTLGLAGNYGSDGSVTTAERWEVRGQSDYAFTDRAYWFGAGRYEDDRFSAFEFQSSLSTVWGTNRFAEVRETGESEDGVILRGDMGLEHQLTDTTKIVDRFLIESGSDNTYVQNDLGLEVTISGSLGYQVRHNTDVRPAVEKTDTLTTVGLIYETK